jgi:small-conductance mechanosensitive channel
MLAFAIFVIFLFSELWRRGTMRYVHDLRRRRQLLLLRRIVVGCTIALFVILSFVTEVGSVATFTGFLAAGLAVALQSLILSVVAYFFLSGRWGVRVGDRVTVSGVTGDVFDVGLFRLYLMELGGAGHDLHATGRIVVFPNAVFFQPTAMFKQIPGIHYTWRTVTLTLAPDSDYALAEKRLLAAVESVYAEYRDTIERQHQAAYSSINLQTPAPQPESRVRFVDSGLEFTFRYPVEIRRASETDSRITTELMAVIENDSNLRLADGSTPKIQALV